MRDLNLSLKLTTVNEMPTQNHGISLNECPATHGQEI